MKERTQSAARDASRGPGPAGGLRPVDAFVVGGPDGWTRGANLWLLLSRPGERLIDFFLEDDGDGRSVADPVPCACAGLTADGRITIGAVDWNHDRFFSEMMDERDTLEASADKGVAR